MGHWGLGVLIDRAYIIDPFSITFIVGPCRFSLNFELKYENKFDHLFKDEVKRG